MRPSHCTCSETVQDELERHGMHRRRNAGDAADGGKGSGEGVGSKGNVKTS